LADTSDWQGDTITAGQLYSELLELNPLKQNPNMFFLVSVRNALLNLTCGRLQAVYNYCQQCSRQISELKPRWPQFEWVLHLILIAILTEWNHLDELRNLLDSAFEKIKSSKRSSWDILYLNVVRGFLAFNDVASAKYILDLLEDGVRTSQLPGPYLNDILAWKIHICLREGNTLLAEEAAKELKHLDFTKPACVDEEAYFSMARLWTVQERFQQAAKLLDALQVNAQRGSRNARLIKIHILRAAVEQRQQRVPTARKSLESAIALGKPEGFVRIFVEEGPVIKRLLKGLLVAGSQSTYVQQLVKAFENKTGSGQSDHTPSGLSEPLSEREQQVLRLLVTHLSQQEMADELCVSVNTIRFHTKSIYRKLGVHERSHAVGKAKASGLL
jgi:ATP/maltotriose-dependent transcriptional regulator MalT